jgi:hypothetical protein
MDPVKALGRTGVLGGFVNKFDGGVEILDDLDDHWTAKHHKDERNWFIQELQELAAEKSVRVTILGGDVHLCAIGQFYSNKKLGIPKDQDHRYMPNVISSAIVNTPPSDMVADVLNKRNKVHHLDDLTDEDMIAMFPEDVNNKPRNNKHLLPHRNWCSIREYIPSSTPPHTPLTQETPSEQRAPSPTRRSSLTGGSFAPRSIMRRLSNAGKRRNSVSADGRPPVSMETQGTQDYFNHQDVARKPARASMDASIPPERPNPFLRRPTGLTEDPHHMVDLSRGLDIRLNVENVQGDPAGTTSEYRLLVPALDYQGAADINLGGRPKGKMRTFFEMMTERGQASPPTSPPISPEQSVRTSGSMTSDGRRRDSMSQPDYPILSRPGPTGPVPPVATAPSRAPSNATAPSRAPSNAIAPSRALSNATAPSRAPSNATASSRIPGPPTAHVPLRGNVPQETGYSRPGYAPAPQRIGLPPDVGYTSRVPPQPTGRNISLPPGVGSVRGGAQPPPGVIQRTAYPADPHAQAFGRTSHPVVERRRASVDMSGKRRSGGFL